MIPMPEATRLMFKHQEVLEALIKRAGLHEGRWQLIMTFGLAGMNMGPSESEVVPGAAVAITGIGLQRASADSPPALTADAAVVNPASVVREQSSTEEPGGAHPRSPRSPRSR
jgi:hypothetical protein